MLYVPVGTFCACAPCLHKTDLRYDAPNSIAFSTNKMFLAEHKTLNQATLNSLFLKNGTLFKKLRTVIYKVSDLAAAKAWYSNLTGKQPYFDEPFYVGFDINGCELGLDPDMTGVQTGNQAVSYWAVESVEEALQKLIASKALLVQPKTNVGGPIHVAIVQDPFGNTLGIIEGA